MSHPLYDDKSKPTDDSAPHKGHPLSDTPESSPQKPKQQPALIVQQTHQAILTYILIAINVAVFFLVNVLITDSFGSPDVMAVVQYSVFAPYIFEQMELYRLFTGMFLHGSLFHILFNMYALYIIGNSVERTFGTLRFGLIYFLGGLAGSVASAIIGDYYVPSIGASGAVFAIWASEAIHVYRHRQLYGGLARSILINTGFFLLLNLFLGFTNTNIDNWGHIGGFIGGAVLTYLIGPRYRLERRITLDGQMRVKVDDDNPLAKNHLILGIYIAGMVVIIVIASMLIVPPS